VSAGTWIAAIGAALALSCTAAWAVNWWLTHRD
jgi:hypothetical protein